MKQSLLLISLTSLLFSCSNGVYLSDADAPYYKLEDVTVPTDSFDSIIERVEIVRFTSEADIYVSPKKALLSDDKMFVLSGGQVLVFGNQGGLLGEVGKIGRGPGEYLSILDICLSNDAEEIWCLNNHNTVLRYSVADYKYKSAVVVKQDGTANAVVPLSKDRFGLLFHNPSGPDLTNFEDSFDCLKCYDLDGNPVDSFLPREDFNLSIAMYSPSIQCSDNGYVLSYISSSGMFYQVKEGGISPLAYFDLGKNALPYRYMIDGDVDPWSRVNSVFESSYIKCLSSVCKNSKYIYGCAYGDHSLRTNYLIDVKTGKGIKWDSSRFAMPVNPIVADDDFFYFVMSPADFPPEYSVELVPDGFQTAVEIKGGFVLDDEMNPVIVKVKFNLDD